MPLPSVSSPFDYLIKQIQTDINRAVEVCEEIKKNRHVGSHHKNLDELEEALSSGASFVRRLAADVEGLPGADPDGGDGKAQ